MIIRGLTPAQVRDEARRRRALERARAAGLTGLRDLWTAGA